MSISNETAKVDVAEQNTMFDRIEALETDWALIDLKSTDAATRRLHLLLGGAIEALKELAYASKPPE